MPVAGYDDYEWQSRRLRRRWDKLVRKGLNPRSLKFNKLLYARH